MTAPTTERNVRLRATLTRNAAYAGAAASAGAFVMLVARALGLVSYSWLDPVYWWLSIVVIDATSAIVIARTTTISAAVVRNFRWLHYATFIPMVAYAMSFLREARWVILLWMFLAIAVTVMMESVWATLALSALSTVTYVTVSYVCITHFGQPGNFAVEAFGAITAIPVHSLMAVLAARFTRQRLALAAARRSAERRSQELADVSAKLAETNATLEQRVQHQVAEVVARARDIEILNAHLRERVRERSREIAATLARLSDSSSEPPGPLPPGTILAERARIDSFLAAGGMGAVYRATDLLTHAEVVVKVIQAERSARLPLLYRFLGEAAAAAAVGHPAIVNVLHVDVAEDGTLFYTAEFIEGETFEGLVARRALDSAGVARVGSVVASALAAAHAAGIVHRDIKPSNLMLTAVAPGVRVLDFGISKAAARDEHAPSDKLTATGEILGTPAYMSPEQIADPSTVGPGTDVYSLGLVLYELVAGRGPYECTTIPQYFVAHQLHAPTPLQSLRSDVAVALASLVHACLAKAPGQRPTAESIAKQLEHIAAALGARLAHELVGVRAQAKTSDVDPAGATVRATPETTR